MSFSQTGRSVCFLQVCPWNALSFKENHAKTKKQDVLICFPVTSSKFLIANWDTWFLDTWLLVDSFPYCFFLLLETKSIFFSNFFSYVRDPFWLPKVWDLEPWSPWDHSLNHQWVAPSLFFRFVIGSSIMIILFFRWFFICVMYNCFALFTSVFQLLLLFLLIFLFPQILL